MIKEVQPDYLAHFPKTKRGYARDDRIGDATAVVGRAANAEEWEELVQYSGPDFRGVKDLPTS